MNDYHFCLKIKNKSAEIIEEISTFEYNYSMENTEINQAIILPRQEDYTQFRYIFPVDFEEKVENLTSSYVKTFKTIMGGLNLEKYKAHSCHVGRESYDYRSMLEMILFAYSEQIFSVRKMAQHCETDIRFMYISGDIKPSHNTIARFIREELSQSIEAIFKEVNDYIEKHDSIDVNTIYIDGTKLEANANKFTFVWKKATLKYQEKLMRKMSKALLDLNEFYQECNIGMTHLLKDKYEVSDFIAVWENLQTIKRNVDTIFTSGRGHRKAEFQKHYELFEEMVNKAMEYTEKIELCGNRNSYSKTDVDATFMHGKEDYYMKTGIFKAYYNIQIGVSNEYIRYIDVYQNPTDVLTFAPFLEAYHRMYGFYPKYPVADAGYGSFENYKYCLEHNMELVQKYGMYAKEHENRYLKNPFNSHNYKKNEEGKYLCPNQEVFEYERTKITQNRGYTKETNIYKVSKCETCPLREKCHSHNKKDSTSKTMQVCEEWNQMKEKVKVNLSSELGIQQRIQRSIQVEGTFGVIKEDWGYERIHRKRIDNVRIEMLLVATGYNLKKFHMRIIERKKESKEETQHLS